MNPARRLLLPLVPLYRAGLAFREWKLRSGREPVRRLGWPVVSIGNLSTGGAGKTPLAIALAQALARRGLYVDVLTRGYGRRSALPLLVNPGGTAEEFGDEPLVIAREAGVPVYVAAERYEAGRLAESALPKNVLKEQDPSASSGQAFSGAESSRTNELAFAPEANVKGTGFSPYISPHQNEGALAPEGSLCIHLLDDGFQHRQLARDADILLLRRDDFEDRLLPAGNLREPLSAIRRAQVIAIPAGDPEVETKLKALGWAGLIWRLRRQMEVPPVIGPVVAFCGIARAEQFFTGLESAGLRVVSRIVFPDHHRYIPHDLDCLLDATRAVRATALVTTEKDRVRLGRLAEKLTAFIPLETAKLRIEIGDEAAAINSLIRRIEPQQMGN